MEKFCFILVFYQILFVSRMQQFSADLDPNCKAVALKTRACVRIFFIKMNILDLRHATFQRWVGMSVWFVVK